MPILWFGISLLIAVFISRQYFKNRPLPGLQLGAGSATVFILALLIGSGLSISGLAFMPSEYSAYADPIIVAVCVMFGLRPLRNTRFWKIEIVVFAVLIAVGYIFESRTFGNITTLLVSISLIPLAIYVDKRWVYVMYPGLALADFLAVRYGAMDVIIKNSQRSFPAAFQLNQSYLPMLRPVIPFSPTFTKIQQEAVWILASIKEIGLLDIALSCLTIALIVRFSGVHLALIAVATIQVSILLICYGFMSGMLDPSAVPFLVVLAPITVIFIAISGDSKRCR